MGSYCSKTNIKSTRSFPVNICFLRQWLLIKKIYLDDLTLCGRVVLHLKNLKSQGHWNWLSGSEEDEEPFKVHRQMGRPTERWTDRQSDQNHQIRWAKIWLTCLKYSWPSFFAWFRRSACPFNTLIFQEKFSIACNRKKPQSSTQVSRLPSQTEPSKTYWNWL